MTIAEQLKLVQAALADWCRLNGGRVFIAADPLDCVDQLRSKPGVPTCGVLWYGDEPRGLDVLGRVDNNFKVVVSRGRGMRLIPGESLTEGASGGPAMFDLVQQAKEIVLALRLEGMEDSEDEIPSYKGTGPFEVNGWLLDAMEIRFSMAAQGTVQEMTQPKADDDN